jgi:hypothetical protein
MITAERLYELTYNEAERALREGRISDEAFGSYQWHWRNDAVRFSYIGESFERTPHSECFLCAVGAKLKETAKDPCAGICNDPDGEAK